MPTYTFACKKCGKKTDKTVPIFMSEGQELLNEKPCDKCGGTDWVRVYTEATPSIHGCTTPGRKD